MEVILVERIRNLGTLGQIVKVKAGYGRNYLIPQGKAVYATPENIKKVEARRAEFEKAEAKHLQDAQDRAKLLAALGVVQIAAKSGEEGKLFGSVGTRDIAEAVTKAGVSLTKSELHLSSGAFRHIGEYEVEIELHSDVRLMMKINIIPEV